MFQLPMPRRSTGVPKDKNASRRSPAAHGASFSPKLLALSITAIFLAIGFAKWHPAPVEDQTSNDDAQNLLDTQLWGRNATITLSNSMQQPIEVSKLVFTDEFPLGVELVKGSVAPGSSTSFQTKVNEVWKARSGDLQKRLLKTAVVGTDSCVPQDLADFVKCNVEVNQMKDYEKRARYFQKTKQQWLSILNRKPPRIKIRAQAASKVLLKLDQRTMKIIEISKAYPKAFLVENFLSREDCRFLIDASKSDPLKARGDSLNPVERSHLPVSHSHRVMHLLKRGTQLLGMPSSQNNLSSLAEGIEVKRFSEESSRKLETIPYFIPGAYPNSWLIQGGNNRFATIRVFLNDDYNGGKFIFPSVHRSCEYTGEIPFKIKTGSALLFYSLHSDGNIDEHSRFIDCEIREGEKWVADLKFWDPFVNTSDQLVFHRQWPQ